MAERAEVPVVEGEVVMPLMHDVRVVAGKEVQQVALEIIFALDVFPNIKVAWEGKGHDAVMLPSSPCLP